MGIGLMGISGSNSASGTYTGDGTAFKDIVTAFKPKFIIVQSNTPGSGDFFFVIDGFPTGYAQAWNASNGGFALETGDIVQINSNGFRISGVGGSSSGINYNTLGQPYCYLAVG